ncbi:MAG: hypothetical protein PHZ09_12370 [Eubacteriales bacterium]|jgi:hypothetical protein|nr:hypothetical protein [Eubacteriales bacterium]
MKRRSLVIIMAILLLFGLSSGIMAAPSPETTGVVVQIQSITDRNGNPLYGELLAAGDAIKADAVKTETIKAALGKDYMEGMITVDILDVRMPEGTAFPVTITFTVKGVTPDTVGYFMHWTGDKWEKVDAIFGIDTMTGTFDSLSPVAFVVMGDVTQVAIGTSPQTSDIFSAGVVILALSAAAFALSKRRVR